MVCHTINIQSSTICDFLSLCIKIKERISGAYQPVVSDDKPIVLGDDGALSFSICDGGFMFDNVTFVGLSEFDNDVIYKITMSVLCGLEYSQCAIE